VRSKNTRKDADTQGFYLHEIGPVCLGLRQYRLVSKRSVTNPVQWPVVVVVVVGSGDSNSGAVPRGFSSTLCHIQLLLTGKPDLNPPLPAISRLGST